MMATIAARTRTKRRAKPSSAGRALIETAPSRSRLGNNLEATGAHLRNDHKTLAAVSHHVLYFSRLRLKRNDAIAAFYDIALIGNQDIVLIEEEPAARAIG